MDDIARDVAQRQDAQRQAAQRQAHNEYVVPAVSSAAPVRRRFPWHDLDRRIQEQILRDAPPHSRRYFTNPDGRFDWTELDAGVRAQIRRHLQEATRRSVSFTVMISQNWPVPYHAVNSRRWRSQRIRNIQDLPMSFTLSFDLIRASVLHFAPRMTVTFSTQLRPEDFLRRQAAERRRSNTSPQYNDREFRELSASELEALCAQMDRTTRWRNVHTIRVIGWPHNGTESTNDKYSFEFVSTDQHGNEVTSTLDTISVYRDWVQNNLEPRFRRELRLTPRLVHLATARRRHVPDYAVPESEFSRTEATEWRVPHTAFQ
jgi:hypothetical protein